MRAARAAARANQLADEARADIKAAVDIYTEMAAADRFIASLTIDGGGEYAMWKADRDLVWVASVWPRDPWTGAIKLGVGGNPGHYLPLAEARYLGVALLAACAEAEK